MLWTSEVNRTTGQIIYSTYMCIWMWVQPEAMIWGVAENVCVKSVLKDWKLRFSFQSFHLNYSDHNTM